MIYRHLLYATSVQTVAVNIKLNIESVHFLSYDMCALSLCYFCSKRKELIKCLELQAESRECL